MKNIDKIKLVVGGAVTLSALSAFSLIGYHYAYNEREVMIQTAKIDLDSTERIPAVARYIDAKNKIDSLDYQIENSFYEYRHAAQTRRDSLQRIVDESPQKPINAYLQKKEELNMLISPRWKCLHINTFAAGFMLWLLLLGNQISKYDKKIE